MLWKLPKGNSKHSVLMSARKLLVEIVGSSFMIHRESIDSVKGGTGSRSAGLPVTGEDAGVAYP